MRLIEFSQRFTQPCFQSRWSEQFQNLLDSAHNYFFINLLKSDFKKQFQL